MKTDKKNRPVFQPGDSSGKVFTELFGYYLNIAEKKLPGVIHGSDIEELHDMRVALRKIRTLISCFRNAMTLEYFRYFKKTYKWLANVLGKVRDVDVYISKVPVFLNQNDPEKMDMLQPVFIRIRENERRKMLRSIRTTVRFGKIFMQSEAFIREPVFRKDSLNISGKLIKDFSAEAMKKMADNCGKTARKLLQQFHRIGSGSENGGMVLLSPEYTQKLDWKIHQLRIRFKYLRYSLEFFSPLLTAEQKILQGILPSIQDILGNYVDTFFLIRFSQLIRSSLPGKPSSASLMEEILNNIYQSKIRLLSEIAEKLQEFLSCREWIVFLSQINEDTRCDLVRKD